MTDDRPDFGVLLSLAGVTFAEELRLHMHASGFVGFTTRTGFVLRLLADEPLSVRVLAERLHMTPQATLKLVEGMTLAGFVDRAPKGLDRRQRIVKIGDRGREALDAAKAFHARFELNLAAEVGADTAREVRHALELVAGRTGVRVPGGAGRDRAPGDLRH
ncbi:MarR family winged helix-turn-helix transcriptional regulator [Nocardioides sp. YIM 152588]|uniref:MarR family winged helix-turn-helix transcriptional regulator n=1 Tax=Nocardioides sp. YIM 152588 TaxID=3158259 RepID=UPI0032E4DA15